MVCCRDDRHPAHAPDDSEAGSSSSAEPDGLVEVESASDNGQSRQSVSKEQRKAHKKAVKEANRERRTKKMPKHVKKKLVNKNKRH